MAIRTNKHNKTLQKIPLNSSELIPFFPRARIRGVLVVRLGRRFTTCRKHTARWRESFCFQNLSVPLPKSCRVLDYENGNLRQRMNTPNSFNVAIQCHPPYQFAQIQNTQVNRSKSIRVFRRFIEQFPRLIQCSIVLHPL